MRIAHWVWSILDECAEKVGTNAGVVAGAFVVAAALRWVLEFLTRVHWVLAAALALVSAVVAVWLTHQVRRASGRADSAGVLGTLALAGLMVAVVGGWISFALHVSGIANYSTPPHISASMFVDLYLWTFVDLVPGLDVLETLHLQPSIQSGDLIGGLPLLGFKAFIVWMFFDALLSWRRKSREADPSSAQPVTAATV